MILSRVQACLILFLVLMSCGFLQRACFLLLSTPFLLTIRLVLVLPLLLFLCFLLFSSCLLFFFLFFFFFFVFLFFLFFTLILDLLFGLAGFFRVSSVVCDEFTTKLAVWIVASLQLVLCLHQIVASSKIMGHHTLLCGSYRFVLSLRILAVPFLHSQSYEWPLIGGVSILFRCPLPNLWIARSGGMRATCQLYEVLPWLLICLNLWLSLISSSWILKRNETRNICECPFWGISFCVDPSFLPQNWNSHHFLSVLRSPGKRRMSMKKHNMKRSRGQGTSATTSISYQGCKEAWRYWRHYSIIQSCSIIQFHKRFNFISCPSNVSGVSASSHSDQLGSIVLCWHHQLPLGRWIRRTQNICRGLSQFKPPLLRGHSWKENKWQVNQQIVRANQNSRPLLCYTMLSILH